MNEYPYLTCSIALAIIAFLTGIIMPQHRKTLLLSGLLSIPSALSSFLFIPEYWNPDVVVHFVLSPEDMLFSAAIGSIAWFFAIFPFAGRIDTRTHVSRSPLRFAFCYLVGVTTYGIAVLMIPGEPRIMSRMLTSMLLVATVLLYVQTDKWILAVSGSFGCAVIHGLYIFLYITVWPHTEAHWNPAAQLPVNLAGVPAFEVIWAAAFGFTWPLLVAYVLGVRWRDDPASPTNQRRKSE